MKIKDKGLFIMGIIFIILAIIVFGIIIFSVYKVQLLIYGILLILFGVSNLVLAFLRKGMEEEIIDKVDERDVYLAMKSGHMTLRIINYLLLAGCLIAFLLYGIFKSTILISIGVTLTAVIILLFTTILLVNSYYEKHA